MLFLFCFFPIKWTKLLGMSLNIILLIHSKITVGDLDKWSEQLIPWMERVSKKYTLSLGCRSLLYHFFTHIPPNVLIIALDSLFNKLHETCPGKQMSSLAYLLLSWHNKTFFLISWFGEKFAMLKVGRSFIQIELNCLLLTAIRLFADSSCT